MTRHEKILPCTWCGGCPSMFFAKWRKLCDTIAWHRAKHRSNTKARDSRYDYQQQHAWNVVSCSSHMIVDPVVMSSVYVLPVLVLEYCVACFHLPIEMVETPEFIAFALVCLPSPTAWSSHCDPTHFYLNSVHSKTILCRGFSCILLTVNFLISISAACAEVRYSPTCYICSNSLFLHQLYVSYH
jgi:hypothetical protein